MLDVRNGESMTFYPFVVYCRGSRGSYRGIGLCVTENSARIKSSHFTEVTFQRASINLVKGDVPFDIYHWSRCEDCEDYLPCAMMDSIAKGTCLKCWQARIKENAIAYDEQKRASNA